jgi:dUTP pyrophosphatase
MKVKIINLSKFPLPEYSTKGAAGIDLKVDFERTFLPFNGPSSYQLLPTSYQLSPKEIFIFKTGLFVEIPEGYELQIRSRSGLSTKGIIIANSPGTIDSDYRGEIGLIISNISSKSYFINDGDRLAQAVLKKVEKIEWEQVEKLEETERGKGGYGHTGVK